MTEVSLFDAIIIWDKILDNTERSQLVTNHWICSCESKKAQGSLDETVAMHAGNMDEVTLLRLHEAFKLSSRAIFFQRKLEKLDKKIAAKWDEILEKFRQKGKFQEPDKKYKSVLKYDILPLQVMEAQIVGGYNYDHLHFIIKNMLRASYNPDNGKFEPLLTTGIYDEKFGVK